MKISFVIPAFNEEKYIGDCLQSILNLHDASVHEIIVVDNGSTDRTIEIARSFERVIIVTEPIKGLPRARQRGLIEASGDLYAAIDADNRVTDQWLAAVKRQFNNNPQIACLIGANEYYDMNDRIIRTKKCIKTIRRLLHPFQKTSQALISRGQGGNSVYRTHALRSIGGFNQDIQFYGEDRDVMLRIRSVGSVVHDENMLVLSSARRINAEGFMTAILRYKINAIWQNITHSPFFGAGKDWR